MLERAPFRARRHAERIGCADVEPARPRRLDERVTDRRNAVRDRERLEAVVAALEHLARPKLEQLVLVGQPSEDPAQRGEEIAKARRAVDCDRHVAAAQREGLQHPRQTQVVIGVIVRQEDLA